MEIIIEYLPAAPRAALVFSDHVQSLSGKNGEIAPLQILQKLHMQNVSQMCFVVSGITSFIRFMSVLVGTHRYRRRVPAPSLRCFWNSQKSSDAQQCRGLHTRYLVFLQLVRQI